MKWQIPAKTFLLGEYAALAENSAIVLTTTPYFELSLTLHKELTGIHPLSPAGLWWGSENKGLSWYDPYQGLGGLGASSAQFLGCYLARCYLDQKSPDTEAMLSAYYQVSWSGKGLRPSGYDVIAQSLGGCVYINKKQNLITSLNWSFKTLSFIILHTGIKLATHEHLLKTTLPKQTSDLSELVEKAKQALDNQQEQELIQAINAYHLKLYEYNLVAEHSLKLIKELSKNPEVLAIKGCGALGADTILIITREPNSLIPKLKARNLNILATEKDLTQTKI